MRRASGPDEPRTLTPTRANRGATLTGAWRRRPVSPLPLPSATLVVAILSLLVFCRYKRPRAKKKAKRELRAQASAMSFPDVLYEQNGHKQQQSEMERVVARYFGELVSEWNPCFDGRSNVRFVWDEDGGAHDVELVAASALQRWGGAKHFTNKNCQTKRTRKIKKHQKRKKTQD